MTGDTDPVTLWYRLLEMAGLDLHSGDGPDVVYDRLQMRDHTEWKRHHVLAVYVAARAASKDEWERMT